MRIYEIFLLLCSQRDNHTSRFVSYLQCRDLSIQPLYMTIHQPRLSTFFPSQNFNQHTLTYCPDNWLKQWVITTPFPGSFLAASKMGSVVDGVGIFQPLSLHLFQYLSFQFLLPFLLNKMLQRHFIEQQNFPFVFSSSVRILSKYEPS